MFLGSSELLAGASAGGCGVDMTTSEPGFFVDHFVKDMGIRLREAAAMHLSVPGLALTHELYVSLQAQGLGRKGTQSLILALGHMAGLEWDSPAPPSD